MPESRRHLLIVLALAACLLVLPRAFIDYGLSGDGLDNAGDALKLVSYGPIAAIPRMIRWPPGVPLFIWLLAGVVPWAGHIGANILVFGSYLAAVALFAAAVAREKHRTSLTVLFAATPFLLLNAGVTQDFMCGLAAALAAYVALSRRAYGVAGLLLGIGIGLRVTNGLLLLPAVAYACCAELEPRIRVRAVTRLVAAAAAVGLLWYLPFILVSGLGWRYFLPLPGHGSSSVLASWKTAVYNWLSVFGLVATVGILAAAAVRRRRIATAIRRDWSDRSPAFFFSVLTILLYAALSLRFTMKAEYVMPAIPFLYLLFARWFDRREVVALTMLVFSYGFLSLDLKGGVSGHRALTLKAVPGVLVDDWQRRRELQDLRAGLGALRTLDHAIVLTGMAGVLTSGNEWLEPASMEDISPALPAAAGMSEHRAVGTIVHRLRGTSVFLVTSLSREHLELARRQGYSVYMFSEYAASAAVNGHHYDPYALQIGVLPVFRPDAFYRHRGADAS